MSQGVLPFQYEEEKKSSGMTALAGLPAYLDLAQVAGLAKCIGRHVRVREGGQGWSDSQMVTSLGARAISDADHRNLKQMRPMG